MSVFGSAYHCEQYLAQRMKLNQKTRHIIDERYEGHMWITIATIIFTPEYYGSERNVRYFNNNISVQLIREYYVTCLQM